MRLLTIMFQRKVDLHIHFDQSQFDRIMTFLENGQQKQIDAATAKVIQSTKRLKRSNTALEATEEN